MWVGNDVPDFKADSHPKDHMGPFIMNPEGVGRIFAPLGGLRRWALSRNTTSRSRVPIAEPASIQTSRRILSPRNSPSTRTSTARPAQGFNIVCTTYRLTEHYHYWTKNNPMNVQLVPEPFVEIPAELADEMGIRGGDKVKVTSARGYYIAKAMVTRRIKPMMIDGKKTYQIGIPIHRDIAASPRTQAGRAKTLANLLSPAAIDPNAYTPESKGFLVKIEKA